MFSLVALALSLALQFRAATSARLLHSLPEDSHAFPKYRVTFLNNLPLLNETADKWLRHGLRGGELEFLDKPWSEDAHQAPSSFRQIGTGDAQQILSVSEPVSRVICEK